MTKLARFLCLGAGVLAMSAAASAEVITFSGLPSTGFPAFTSPYTEGGFTVTPTAGTYHVGDAFGDPTPDLFQFIDPATITVTENGGGDFTFNGIDLANYNNTGGSYTIQGFLGGSLAFTLNSSIGGDTVFNNYSGAPQTISSLTITLTNGNGESDLDNIDVSPAAAATPEPSSLILLGSGLLGLAGTLRRRLA